jgi:peptidyl-prolyl cis-trans isomerase C
MNKPLFPEISVGGRVIPAADIAAEAQNHEAPASKPGIAWRKAARALVIRALLLDEAARLGLTPEPQEIEPGKTETEEEALIRAAMEAGVSPAPVRDAQIRTVYDRDPGRFRSPTLFEAAHILLAASPDDPEALARAEKRAAMVLDALAAGRQDFASLALEYSDCPSRKTGGQLGQIGPGDTVPEFEAALAALGEGETSSTPVKTRYGLHIIRMIAKADGAPLPFDIVRPYIAETLEKAAWARAARDFTEQLVSNADISGIEMSAPLT